MDTFLNMKAFLAAARSGNFSAAARDLGVSPSAVTKRVGQLEEKLDARLFTRSTRQVRLTPAGERYLSRIRTIITEYDDIVSGASESTLMLEGYLRVKTPSTFSLPYFTELFTEFQLAHPGVSLNLVLMDRAINPLDEGYDIAIGALPASFGGVVDVPLCPYPRITCAAPAYLARKGLPRHPRELVDHDCLAFTAMESVWTFESSGGPLSVNVRPRLSVNQHEGLLSAARNGLGIVIAPDFTVRADLAEGNLIPVLGDFPPVELWLKAMIPERRFRESLTVVFLNHLKAKFSPSPPWSST